MAVWARRADNIDGVVHHSDRGVQYLSIVYTERLAEAGAVASAGSRGDSYDNAVAESINGLYKSELIYNETQGPWRTVEDVELATLGWVHWWNTKRLLEPIGSMPPAEFEARWRAADEPARTIDGERRRGDWWYHAHAVEHGPATASSTSLHIDRASIKPRAIQRSHPPPH